MNVVFKSITTTNLSLSCNGGAALKEVTHSSGYCSHTLDVIHAPLLASTLTLYASVVLTEADNKILFNSFLIA